MRVFTYAIIFAIVVPLLIGYFVAQWPVAENSWKYKVKVLALLGLAAVPAFILTHYFGVVNFL